MQCMSTSHPFSASLRARRSGGGLRLTASLVLWRVLTVEVVVLCLSRRLVHLVLGAVIVGVLVHRVLVRAGDAASIVRGQELVHRVVRRIFVLGVRDHVPVLVLVITIVIV